MSNYGTNGYRDNYAGIKWNWTLRTGSDNGEGFRTMLERLFQR
jgi:hypothetical protein